VITQALVRTLFDHIPTGELVSRVKTNKRWGAGRVVGTKANDGYVYIRIDGRIRLAHRLIWLYHYGYLPEQTIDHINRVRHDNRLENLREASYQCNLKNGTPRSSISGIKGVCWDSIRNRWFAQIAINSKKKNLGRHTSLLEAACLRLAAEQCLGWHDCDVRSPAKEFVERNIPNTNF
jgi:hypothetical protein